MCDGVRYVATRGRGWTLGPARLDLFVAWLRKAPALRREVFALHRQAFPVPRVPGRRHHN